MQTQAYLNKSFNIGEITTCQFGNEHDAERYAPDHECTVIGKHYCPIAKQEYFLVKKHGENVMGRAFVRSYDTQSVHGELYCTNALAWGDKKGRNRIPNPEYCASVLGFDDEKVNFTLM